MNRTSQSIKNIVASVVGQTLITVCQFLSRSVFIDQLTDGHLGINALFLNVLSILNMAELGVGAAFSVALYRLLAIRDEDKITAYMALFKKLYWGIGGIIFAFGIGCMPFLPLLLKDQSIPENIYLVFLLYLLNSVMTYIFLSYRTILVSADQKKYYNTIYSTIATVLISLLQIVVLLTIQNFYLYLIIPIVLHFFVHTALGVSIGKKYPYIKKKTTTHLRNDEIKALKTNVFSVLIYKLATTFNTSADSIIISVFISNIIVGFHSNYIMIINAVSTLAFLVVHAVTDSVGNLNVSADTSHKEEVFLITDYVNYGIFGFSAVTLLILLNPFISWWIGKEYLFSVPIVLVFVLNFLTEGLLQPSYVFRNACGLYKYGRIRPLLTLLFNIVLSITLAKPLGISGVILATIIARLTTASWFEPCMVYQRVFHKRPTVYFLYHGYYAVLTVLSYLVLSFVFKFFSVATLPLLLLSTVLCAIIYFLIFIGGTFFLQPCTHMLRLGKQTASRLLHKNGGV